MSGSSDLLPRASLKDTVLGRSPLVGSRLDPEAPRGFVSPLEARIVMGFPYGDPRSEERSVLARGGLSMVMGSVLKACVARLLQPRTQDTRTDRAFVVSALVHNLSVDEAIAALLAPTAGARSKLAYLVHPHALNLAVLDSVYRTRLSDADLILPDGAGLRLGAALLGSSLRHNLCGTDLVPELQQEMINRGVPLVLVGGRPGVAQRCAARWKEARPQLQVPVISHGYLNDADIRALRDEIRAVGRCVVLVGMGSPVQEEFAATHLADLPGATVLTVGGLFDYFADRVARAPMIWRELGIEWVFRTLQEPRRLLLRYLIGNPFFLLMVAAQRWGLR